MKEPVQSRIRLIWDRTKKLPSLEYLARTYPKIDTVILQQELEEFRRNSIPQESNGFVIESITPKRIDLHVSKTVLKVFAWIISGLCIIRSFEFAYAHFSTYNSVFSAIIMTSALVLMAFALPQVGVMYWKEKKWPMFVMIAVFSLVTMGTECILAVGGLQDARGADRIAAEIEAAKEKKEDSRVRLDNYNRLLTQYENTIRIYTPGLAKGERSDEYWISTKAIKEANEGIKKIQEEMQKETVVDSHTKPANFYTANPLAGQFLSTLFALIIVVLAPLFGAISIFWGKD